MKRAQATALLRQSGLPVKSDYVEILALFCNAPQQFFTVHQVYQELLPHHPTINLSSTYRIVRILRVDGVLACEPGAGGHGGGMNRFRFSGRVP